MIFFIEYFRRALDLMHRSSGLPMPATTETPLPPPPMPPTLIVQPPALMDLQLAAPPQLEFKELVSQKCAERGILFVPMPGRREAGKQVFRVGKLFCYINRSVVMVSDGSFTNWAPISIKMLLERAVSGNVF